MGSSNWTSQNPNVQNENRVQWKSFSTSQYISSSPLHTFYGGTSPAEKWKNLCCPQISFEFSIKVLAYFINVRTIVHDLTSYVIYNSSFIECFWCFCLTKTRACRGHLLTIKHVGKPVLSQMDHPLSLTFILHHYTEITLSNNIFKAFEPQGSRSRENISVPWRKRRPQYFLNGCSRDDFYKEIIWKSDFSQWFIWNLKPALFWEVLHLSSW